MPPFVSTGPSVPPENARIFTAQAVLFMINVRIIRKKQEKIWWNKIKAVPLHSLIRNDVATLQGVLTERLGNGLQNRVERFDSARHLFRKKGNSFIWISFFFVYIPLTSEPTNPVCSTRPERACGNKMTQQGVWQQNNITRGIWWINKIISNKVSELTTFKKKMMSNQKIL